MTEDPDVSDDFSMTIVCARAEQRLDHALFMENKTTLFAHLAATETAKVVVTFDGGGDSGQIESIDAEAADGTCRSFPSGTLAFRLRDGPKGKRRNQTLSPYEGVESLVYDCLGQAFCGWENNEGGYGHFIFDVAARTIRLEMNERVTESILSTVEF